jgi:hypothetical protein
LNDGYRDGQGVKAIHFKSKVMLTASKVLKSKPSANVVDGLCRRAIIKGNFDRTGRILNITNQR